MGVALLFFGRQFLFFVLPLTILWSLPLVAGRCCFALPCRGFEVVVGLCKKKVLGLGSWVLGLGSPSLISAARWISLQWEKAFFVNSVFIPWVFLPVTKIQHFQFSGPISFT